MSYSNLIPALLFALAGLAAIIYIGKALLSNLLRNIDIFSFIRGSSLRRKSRSLAAARTHFEGGEMDRCVRSLKESLFLEPPLINLQFLDAAYDHNFDVLGFLVTVNQEMPDRLLSLPRIEGLLQDRLHLHRALAESYLSLDAVKAKRSEDGKKTPEWAISEFEKKISNIQEELAQNGKEFLKEFVNLCEAILANAPDDNQLTYH